MKLLLENTSDTVQAELHRRQAARHEDGEHLGWQGRHHEYMKLKGVRWVQLSATPSIVKSVWFQLCTQREKEIIAFAMKYAPT